MENVTGNPLIDWLLSQAPVIAVLGITAWRLEGTVRLAMLDCQQQRNKLLDLLARLALHGDQE